MDQESKIRALKDKTQYRIKLLRKNMKNDIYKMMIDLFKDPSILNAPMICIQEILKEKVEGKLQINKENVRLRKNREKSKN